MARRTSSSRSQSSEACKQGRNLDSRIGTETEETPFYARGNGDQLVLAGFMVGKSLSGTALLTLRAGTRSERFAGFPSLTAGVLNHVITSSRLLM